MNPLFYPGHPVAASGAAWVAVPSAAQAGTSAGAGPTTARARRSPRQLVLVCCLPLLLLAGCFGGGGDEGAQAGTEGSGTTPMPHPPAGQGGQSGDVPASALTDAAAFTRFVAAQVAATDTPLLALGALTAPVSETDAPAPVL